MNKKTWIMALAVVLAVLAANAPLWAQSESWPAWQGKDNADKKAWDEVGACWTGLMDANRLLNTRNIEDAADRLLRACLKSSHKNSN